MAKEPDERPQLDKFRDLVRHLEADEDETKFEGAMRRIAKAPPPPMDDE